MLKTSAPFTDLNPDSILDALATIGVHSDGRLLALNSYENRVYQVGIEDSVPVIVKFYRPQRWSDCAILEEHAFLQALAAAEVPVVPPLMIENKTLHEFGGYRFSLFKRYGGRAPELDQQGVRPWLGRFIARIHAIGAADSYEERPTLDSTSFGVDPSRYLLEQGFIPLELRAVYESVVQQALEGVARCVERAGKVKMLRLHGDCHLGNVLWTDAGPHFVDFDDSRMGPAVQDLWMLLSGERKEMAAQLQSLLQGYDEFHDFDRRELHQIEALRTLRLIHYSAWIASRWQDPAFPKAFPWFNTQHYWQDRILELREQIALMDEAPLLAGYL